MFGELLKNTLELYLDAAPWLLLGLIAAGLIKAWLPESLLSRWLGGSGLWPMTRAALIGAPLPLCSCGVLPAALGLHRNGASRSSTISFLIATPETGVDSIALSYALLGPVMAVVRPIAAILSAIVAGLLTALVPEARPVSLPLPVSSGCSGGTCCSNDLQSTATRSTPLTTSLKGLRYAASDILDDIALWLAIGIVLAGAVTTWIPPQALAAWGSGLPAMLLMLIVGVPMYICATASTPLAAALLLAGLSPGTVLVFLLAGPATNLATLAVVRKEFGTAILATYLLGISLSSIVLGLLLDWLLSSTGLNVIAQIGEAGEVVPLWLAWISGALLLLLAIRPLRRRLLY